MESQYIRSLFLPSIRKDKVPRPSGVEAAQRPSCRQVLLHQIPIAGFPGSSGVLKANQRTERKMTQYCRQRVNRRPEASACTAIVARNDDDVQHHRLPVDKVQQSEAGEGSRSAMHQASLGSRKKAKRLPSARSSADQRPRPRAVARGDRGGRGAMPLGLPRCRARPKLLPGQHNNLEPATVGV